MRPDAIREGQGRRLRPLRLSTVQSEGRTAGCGGLNGAKVSAVLELCIDTDACPVKQEICKVAKRHHLSVTFVANSWIRLPDQEGV